MQAGWNPQFCQDWRVSLSETLKYSRGTTSLIKKSESHNLLKVTPKPIRELKSKTSQRNTQETAQKLLHSPHGFKFWEDESMEGQLGPLNPPCPYIPLILLHTFVIDEYFFQEAKNSNIWVTVQAWISLTNVFGKHCNSDYHGGDSWPLSDNINE